MANTPAGELKKKGLNSAVVYSKAFKIDIKLAIAIFYKNGTETARKMYFSTDLKQA